MEITKVTKKRSRYFNRKYLVIRNFVLMRTYQSAWLHYYVRFPWHTFSPPSDSSMYMRAWLCRSQNETRLNHLLHSVFMEAFASGWQSLRLAFLCRTGKKYLLFECSVARSLGKSGRLAPAQVTVFKHRLVYKAAAES